jgi:oxygen-independent coproporphyrinogen III oxidase
VSLAVLNHAPARLDPAALPPTQVEALYVHIPFCFHKCHYCDFYSITRQSPQRMERFVDLLLIEAEMWTRGPVSVRPRTIFFGGGTPTLLPIEAMSRLLAGLRERFEFSDVAEWTIEANPATVTIEYCQMLRAAGVDRLSFGAQSFDPRELKTLERHHDPDDVPRSVAIAREAGFTRLNLDLIFAVPGQDLSSWSDSLERAIALDTPHLSAYGLTFEPNTPIAVKKRLGTMQQIEESLELEMLRHTRARLAEVGRPPYEVSNFAAPGEECQHNLVYWTGGNYIGLGPSAASHVEGWRWRNRPHLGEWERAVGEEETRRQGDRATRREEEGESDSSPSRLVPLSPCRPHPPAIDVEHLTPLRRAGELAMLLLRLTRGLNFADFAARTGLDARTLWSDQIDRFTKTGLLTCDDRGFRLSERGLPVADALAAEFVDPADV